MGVTGFGLFVKSVSQRHIMKCRGVIIQNFKGKVILSRIVVTVCRIERLIILVFESLCENGSKMSSLKNKSPHMLPNGE